MVSVRADSHRRPVAVAKRSADPSGRQKVRSCLRTLCLAALLACLMASLQCWATRALRRGGSITGSLDGKGGPMHKQQVFFRGEDAAADRDAALRQRKSPDDAAVERSGSKAEAQQPKVDEGGGNANGEEEGGGDDEGDDGSDDKSDDGKAGTNGEGGEGSDDKDEYQKKHAGEGANGGPKKPASVTVTSPGNNHTGASPPAQPIATVAYAVSVTGCGSDPITEGAAVLRHSIHLVSSRVGKSKYDYEMLAIYHPSAEACAKPLEELGYRLLKRDVFVNVADIQGDFLRERIETNGCCGEKELIKLEAYTLTDYPIFVHLDLDVLVLKPMDDIFDMMLLEDAPPSPAIMWPDKSLPKVVNAFYTYDYNMVWPSAKRKPVQGGFLVARPDMAVYEEFRQIVLKGDFREGSGWGGAVGPFHGSMTFQGIVPYYYDVLHSAPRQSIELNRCIYNQMCDNPRDKKTVNDVVTGRCRTGEAECEDCRSRPLEDVVTHHATLCQKFWTCLPHSNDRIQERLCRKLAHEWFRVRSDLEKSWGRSGMGPSEWERDHFFGYCSHAGGGGYQRIEPPYGPSQQAQR